MTRLLLVRHGETGSNSARMFVGHSDVELSALGRIQVEKLRDRLAAEKIDVIYTSDLKRAMMTSEAIASNHRSEAIACPELREINYGQVEGLTFEEIKRFHPEVAELCVDWSPRLQFPGGESFEEFRERVSGFTDGLRKLEPEQTALVVAHGGTLRLMICRLLEIEPWHWRQINIDLASLSIVDTHPDIAIVRLLNDTSHLK